MPATGVVDAKTVAAGGYRSFAARANGDILAWGSNAYGELATGTTADARVPQAVPALAGAKALVAGTYNTLAVRPDGTAVAVGYNGTGAVGDGTTTGDGGSTNRLTPTQVAGYTRGTAPLATYAYTSDGLRTAKTVAGVTTTFTWDQAGGLPMLLAQTTADATTRIVYGPGGLPLAQIDPAGTTSWYHHDQLGSTRLTTTNTATVASTATYDAYGQPTAQTGTTPRSSVTPANTPTPKPGSNTSEPATTTRAPHSS